MTEGYLSGLVEKENMEDRMQKAKDEVKLMTIAGEVYELYKSPTGAPQAVRVIEDINDIYPFERIILSPSYTNKFYHVAQSAIMLIGDSYFMRRFE